MISALKEKKIKASNEKEQKTKKKKRPAAVSFTGLVSESLILPFFYRVALALLGAIKNSAVGRFFCAYDRGEALRTQSLHTLPAERMNRSGNILRPVRFAVAKQFDNSAILASLSRFGERLSGLPLSVYGFACLFFSLFSSGIFAFRYVTDTLEPGSYGNLAVSVIFLAIGIILIASRKHFSEALCQSRLVGFVLFRMLGVRDSWFRALPPAKGRMLPAAVIGSLLGLLTYVIPPEFLFFGVLVLLAMLLIYKIPEAGVVAGIFFIPFAILILPHPSMLLAGYSIYLVFCFLLKFLRGKRTVRFEWLDLCVLLFMAVMLFAGLFSANPSDSLKPVAIFLSFMLWYFLIANLIRSWEWVERAVSSLLCSAVIVALYGIYQNFFVSAVTTWQDVGMFSDISGRVVSTFENPNVLAEYLILCFPIAAARLFEADTKRRRLVSLCVCGVLGACLVFTWSRGAWLGLLIGMFLFFLFFSDKTLVAVLFGLCAVPFLPFVLPDSITNRFLSIGNLADTSTSYRVHIWQGVLKMLRDHFLGGIGVGVDVFQKIYPLYSLSGIESAPHSHNLYLQVLVECGIFGLLVFLIFLLVYAQYGFTRLSKPMNPRYRLLFAGIFCGVVAVLAQGMTDYIWYNYRVFLMFWISIGLTAAVGRTSQSETRSPENEPAQDADSIESTKGL